MTGLIVATSNRFVAGLITGIVAMLIIAYFIAVVMVAHIGVHICLIVAEIYRTDMAVIVWIVVPIVYRTIALVAIVMGMPIVKHRRTTDEYRRYVIVGTIDILRTDYLYVRVGIVGLELCHYSSHILEHILRQTCLDNKQVGIALIGLNHAKIIHPAITIKVKRVNHILG